MCYFLTDTPKENIIEKRDKRHRNKETGKKERKKEGQKMEVINKKA